VKVHASGRRHLRRHEAWPVILQLDVTRDIESGTATWLGG
jgi:hypothetical protein